MNKNTVLIIGIIIVVVGGVVLLWSQMQRDGESASSAIENTSNIEVAKPDIGQEDVKEIGDGIYKIDPGASVINWKGTAIGKEHVGDVRVANGTLTIEGGSVRDGSVVIDMTSINDHDLDGVMQQQLVQHLKSDDFFAVETYPEVTLLFTDVADTPYSGVYRVTADLTIRGITHPVIFDLIVTPDADVIMAKTDLVIDRTQWDITFGSERFMDKIGATIIDDEISLHMDLRATVEE